MNSRQTVGVSGVRQKSQATFATATIFVVLALGALSAWGQTKPGASKAAQSASSKAATRHVRTNATAAPNLTKQPTLYVVGYAHLDTEWRWEYPQVIDEYLANTLHDNFALFKKYPHYVFNFTGSNRYRFFKEYYPADYATLKKYIAEGRWFPAGSSVEESDVNSPSAESIFRQVLYGNEFFRREFGKASTGYMLPDCFGFPASLPSILAHAGIKGFSTQKLTWGSSAPGGPGVSPEDTPVGIPFNVGMWIGPDGHGVIAALNPGSYGGSVTTDLTSDPEFVNRVHLDGKVTGVVADYHYYGTGDVGGSPNEQSVKTVEAILDKGSVSLPPPRQPGESYYAYRRRMENLSTPPVQVGEGPLHVIAGRADQMFLDLTPADAARLPSYKGEFELTNHSAGSLTSEAYQKRWVRKNEELADAAEEASVAAAWLDARPYPQKRITDAWTLLLGGQFHDLMAGTATPRAYNFAWNDDVITMNQFASVLSSAAEGVSSAMNTEGAGTPIVVYNPLNIDRQDVVTANISFPGGEPQGVRVTGPNGKEVLSQIAGEQNGKTTILFLADVPSIGFAVFHVAPADQSPASNSGLKVSESSIENARYRVSIDKNGDVSSVFDKQLNRELLSAPARLAFETEHPHDWPAWNMDWDDQKQPPRGYVDGPAQIKVVENGPVRVAVQIERESEGSKFIQTVRLSAGAAGNRVEFANSIDWHTSAAALKATFPLTASNPQATYNWDVGTIARSNDYDRKFEFPSHQWFDLTDASGEYGVTILSDCKNGSDKPDDNTLRLTLLYTPGLGTGNGRDYSDQTSQDWGHHEFVYGLAGHAGDWRDGQTDWQAWRLNQPLIAFESDKHAGSLGSTFSLLKVNNSRIRVLALKKAEYNDDLIVRLVELSGEPQHDVRLAFAAPVVSAREANAQEQLSGPATIQHGEIVTNFTPYQPRTFELKLAPARAKAPGVESRPVQLNYDLAAASDVDTHSQPGFDASGQALAAGMLPTEINYGAIHFKLAPSATGKSDALVARGQSIALPAGNYNRVYVLAASSDGDQSAEFRVGETPVQLTVEDWGGFVGQWDNRSWNMKEVPIHYRSGFTPPPNAPKTRTEMEFNGQITPGFIKRAPIAWYCDHRHTSDGKNEAYSYSYLFAYALNLPAGSKTITLPDNDKIRVLAISVAREPGITQPAEPLYDTLQRNSGQ
ncbi:MAG TPA: glycoside hydrolase family 38 C-terminal domain-containing protein [Candidatus Acidoferrales bacterium]|nr:glycoside hydrolase family 38 C-terminal domain-containing protein [Candidatus Acidoferrales bacterium]